MQCKICNRTLKKSPGSIIVCNHKRGIVHLGCCVDHCSLDEQPCKHVVLEVVGTLGEKLLVLLDLEEVLRAKKLGV